MMNYKQASLKPGTHSLTLLKSPKEKNRVTGTFNGPTYIEREGLKKDIF